MGVNGAGHESDNGLMTAGRALPLLQDTPAVDAWSAWAVAYRDVVIVDGQGVKRGVFNVTLHDLSVAANRAALKQQLLDAR